MYKTENCENSYRHNLPAQLRRELQVEEFWARRAVLEARMNLKRLDVYVSRRAQAPVSAAASMQTRYQ